MSIKRNKSLFSKPFSSYTGILTSVCTHPEAKTSSLSLIDTYKPERIFEHSYFDRM